MGNDVIINVVFIGVISDFFNMKFFAFNPII